MTTTSNPKVATLGDYSDHQLLTLILTELRLHTYLMFQQEAREEEIEALRAELMNDNDTVDADVGIAFPGVNS